MNVFGALVLEKGDYSEKQGIVLSFFVLFFNKKIIVNTPKQFETKAYYVSIDKNKIK